MKTKKAILAPVLGAMTLLSSQVAQADVLRIGVEGAYPPFSKKEANGSGLVLTLISRTRFAGG